jgi:indole-3-glycerol phosphate synthase
VTPGEPAGRAGVLDAIIRSKRDEVTRLRAGPKPSSTRTPGGGVVEALARPPGAPLRLLAEVKLRSPSAGELSRALRPADRALAYARAGAVMISVLTDGPFFGGAFDDLAACRDALDEALGRARPRLLCKEFVLEPVQLDHARAAGADAVLLIARLAPPAELAALAGEARARGLEPLVEVATREQLADALAAGARVVGVNARDLDTLRMDAARAADVLARIGGGAVAVHLSGLAGPDDVARVARGPADAALVGEALMRRDDPTALLAAMVAAAG